VACWVHTGHQPGQRGDRTHSFLLRRSNFAEVAFWVRQRWHRIRRRRRDYFAVALGGGLPLVGIFLVAAPKRRRFSTLLGLIIVVMLVTVPACGGGGGSSHQQDPGTPAGAYTVIVTAAAGSLSTQKSFTLTVK